MQRKEKFFPGGIFHVYNRGVEKREIFFDNADYWRFLQGLYLFNDSMISPHEFSRIEREKGARNFSILKQFFQERGVRRDPLVRVMANCLMPNHFHLVLEEVQDGGISKFMHKLGTGYVAYFNKKYNRVGGLFQGRFKTKFVNEDLYLQYLLAYIHVINPADLIGATSDSSLPQEKVRGVKNMLRFAETYSWSTHKEYMGARDSVIIDKGRAGTMFREGDSYRKFCEEILQGRQYHLLKSFFA